MLSATITQWHKAEGDAVAAGDLLVTAEWEQGLLEVACPADGTLRRILCPAGQTARAGAPIAKVAETSAEAVTPAPAAAPPPAPSGPVTPIVLPQAGQSMEEGTIVKWIARVGQDINVGDVIFEVETDKAAIEVEAVEGGRLAKIVVQEGQTVPVKTPVAYLAGSDADVEAYLASQPAGGIARFDSAQHKQPQADGGRTVTPVAEAAGGRIKASPAARKAAAERGMDLAAIATGSGPGGRIVLADLVATGGEGVIRRSLKGMRKAIARSLTMSKQTIPHFYLRVTVNAEPMMAFYRRVKAETDCTLNDVIALAAASSAAEFPAFRTRLEGDQLVEYPTVNLGVAVGTDEGLVVPVVVGADRMSLAELAAETKRVVEAARGGKVHAMGQGTMTISNLGMFGVEEFAAIINPPESSLLAVSAVREAPVAGDGKVLAARVMTLTISCDHRVVDGVVAAKYAARLKELLEQAGGESEIRNSKSETIPNIEI